METPLNASSTTAGGLLSGGRFRVPQFQREYAWGRDEVSEFFSDLAQSLTDETYFLGLVIVTGDGSIRDIVDGQQRLLTLTLLTAALHHETNRYERMALAGRLQSTFLRSIDFDSDEELPRLELASEVDDRTLKEILDHPASELQAPEERDESVSGLLVSAYQVLTQQLVDDLKVDPFKRLGAWADFLTNRLYFAVFVHPDPASAYRVFEVINTRGKELTTADLLKSYVLSQTPEEHRQERYGEWNQLAGAFIDEGPGAFVQFIRHAVTVERGHVLPRDLYDVLTGRRSQEHIPVRPTELISLLEDSLPAYRQMIDPTAEGPVASEGAAVFAALRQIGVVSVRPILLALQRTPNPTEGMRSLLQLVVRRMVVGNLGTGNVERRFGQTAQRIASDKKWEDALGALADLNHDEAEFRERVHHRSMNKSLLAFIRASILQRSITPETRDSLFLIKPRNADWSSDEEDRATYWVSTIGNTFLATEDRRPMGSSSWEGFKTLLLPNAARGEWVETISGYSEWHVQAITDVGEQLAEAATSVWYP